MYLVDCQDGVRQFGSHLSDDKSISVLLPLQTTVCPYLTPEGGLVKHWVVCVMFLLCFVLCVED